MGRQWQPIVPCPPFWIRLDLMGKMSYTLFALIASVSRLL